jgi:hypothetical protein
MYLGNYGNHSCFVGALCTGAFKTVIPLLLLMFCSLCSAHVVRVALTLTTHYVSKYIWGLINPITLRPRQATRQRVPRSSMTSLYWFYQSW